jgi:putative endopeptidase
LRDWWTANGDAHFAALAAQLTRLFDACFIEPGRHTNGRLTVGESIADLGGLRLALDAYHATLGGRPAPVIDNLSSDQRFFLGFARLRRAKHRPEALRASLLSDPHAPDRCHVNETVRNFNEWYDAFGVGSKDSLFLSIDERAGLW